MPSTLSTFTEIWKQNSKYFFLYFPNLNALKVVTWAPFALYVSYLWNTSGTRATRCFLASDAHTPCCIFLHGIFYVFEGDLCWRKRDWPQHFQVKLFHAHVVCQLKN